MAPRGSRPGPDTRDVLAAAVGDCLAPVGARPDDVDLLSYAGTYRTAFTSEPAIAALVAGQLGFNASGTGKESTLAFDVMNGAMGFLNACHVSTEMIRARKATRAVVMASEVENNRAHFPQDLVGVEETGSAVLLEASGSDAGLVRFHFRAFPEHVDAFASWCTNREGKAYLRWRRSADLTDRSVKAIVVTVSELLTSEDLPLSAIARIFPPQI